MSWKAQSVVVAGLAFLTGCNQYALRYQPHPQVLASPIFADYRVQPQSVDIVVDTNGMRLEQIAVVEPDGRVIHPTSIDYPPFKSDLVQGVDTPINGPEFAQGPTVSHFDKSAIGPAPWKIQVAIQTLPEETISVGEPQSSR